MSFKLFLVALFCVTWSSTPAESLNIISRAEWGAREPVSPSRDLSVNPPSHVAIHHSASRGCTTKAACIALVQSFQNWHMDNNQWNDIGYNFIVGEDGNVYEGQGWGKHGAHAIPVNSKSIGICIIGTFIETTPNAAAQKATQELIAYGVQIGKISTNYKLIGHRQVTSTECPGSAFYDVIKKWKNWTNTP